MSVYRTDSELDETARLILMDAPEIRMIDLRNALNVNLDREITLREITDIWTKYRGWDGRVRPTHSFVTGRPIR